jgi:serine/threonine-protein kinase OSR1/STK39
MEDTPYPNTAEGYVLVELIGKGMFNNEVWRATVPSRNNDEVAIKIIDLEEYSQDNLESIRKEVQIMNRSRHDHIVPYYCSFVEKTKLWLVMRMLAGSCLDLLRYRYPNGIEDEAIIAVIMRAALNGLSYLHAHQQLHRDIKAANILLAPNGRVQLADFGVSAALDAHDQRRTTFVGTVCYMAPEVLDPSETGGYDVKCDSWSLGITAIELAYGKPPYALNQPMKVIMLLMKHPSPSLEVPELEAKTLQLKPDRKFSAAFRNFVDLCLQKDPQNRPTAQQLLDHAFLKNLPADESVCCAYLAKHLLTGLPSVGERYRQHAAKAAAKASGHSTASTSSSSNSSSSTNTATTSQPKSSSQFKDEEDLEWDFGDDTKAPKSSTPTPKKVGFKGFSEEVEVDM